ncbi:MAG: hypothetical protein ACI8S6_000145 [Myxococcota bacterium]
MPPHSVAMLLLATARAGTRPAPPGLIRKLIGGHILAPGLRADAVMHSALGELEASWKRGGLRQVAAQLQAHCARLSDILDEDERRQIVSEMLQVASAVTTDDAARDRVAVFPYAAARAWQLDDLAATLMKKGAAGKP